MFYKIREAGKRGRPAPLIERRRTEVGDYARDAKSLRNSNAGNRSLRGWVDALQRFKEPNIEVDVAVRRG